MAASLGGVVAAWTLKDAVTALNEGNSETSEAGHADDLDGPMFRPLSHNRKGQEGRRHMDPDAIDRVLRKHAKP